MAPTPRRKKWTEEEERTLIEKYGEMVCNGVLSKMKTREKKFRPIAAQVNSLHHAIDPVAFPWQWSWKDASTKVQNMRHQYLLVKQKIKKPSQSLMVVVEEDDGGGVESDEQFDWVEGISHWPNFLRYKNVFGDVPLLSNTSINISNNDGNGSNNSFEKLDLVDFASFGGEDGVLGLGYYDDEGDNGNSLHNNGNGHVQMQDDGDDGLEYDDVFASGSKKKRRKNKGMEKQAWAFFGNQFAEMRERERLYEDKEVGREQKRLRREQAWGKIELERRRKMSERDMQREEKERVREKMRRERNREWEAMEKEREERERRRREEELSREMEWQNRREQRRLDSMNRIDNMLSQHRASMDEIQSRILHEQQNLTNQLLGMLSQWTGHPSSIPDHTGAGNTYLSQMLQNFHHMTGIVHNEENRVEEDNHHDQFIVDDG